MASTASRVATQGATTQKQKDKTEKKKKWNWEYSWAKEILRMALVDGDISPQHTYDEMHAWHPEIQETDRRLLPNRVRSLQKQIKDDTGKAEADALAYAHDRSLFPIPTHNHRGEPRWQGSEAERLLKEDIKNGIHLTMSPMEFYDSREVYSTDYSEDVIRHHIYQEIKLIKYCKYRNDKKKSSLFMINFSSAKK